jgi:hypothetical protein
MVMGTHSAPEFFYNIQKQLWDIRCEHAMLTGFKFKEGLEERLITSLFVEEATAEVAEAEVELRAWKAKASEKRKTKGKKTAPPSSDKPDTGTGDSTSQDDSGGNKKNPNGG